MSASTQIEKEVEATRASVESTVEALKDKMTIGQIVDEATTYFKDSAGSQLVSNLGTQIRDNPLPLMLVGIGLAWLMSGRGSPHMRDKVSEFSGRANPGNSGYPDYTSWSPDREPDHSDSTVGESFASAAGEKTSRVGFAAWRAARAGTASGANFAARAGSAANSAWQGSAEAYEGVQRTGASAYHGAARLQRRARHALEDVFDTEPLVLGALGVAFGTALGTLLPRTETEDRLLREPSSNLREEIEGYATEQYERGKRAAERALRAANEASEQSIDNTQKEAASIPQDDTASQVSRRY